MVRSTAVELESVHAEPLNSKNTISLAEARKLDLETAVLMQVRYPAEENFRIKFIQF